jgi:hypothetical protein
MRTFLTPKKLYINGCAGGLYATIDKHDGGTRFGRVKVNYPEGGGLLCAGSPEEWQENLLKRAVEAFENHEEEIDAWEDVKQGRGNLQGGGRKAPPTKRAEWKKTLPSDVVQNFLKP